MASYYMHDAYFNRVYRFEEKKPRDMLVEQYTFLKATTRDELNAADVRAALPWNATAHTGIVRAHLISKNPELVDAAFLLAKDKDFKISSFLEGSHYFDPLSAA